MRTPRERPEARDRGMWLGPTAVALLFLFLGGSFASAAGMHGCPLHHHAPPGDPAGSGAAAPSAPSPQPGHGPSASADHRTDGHGDGDGSACTCLGDCQSGAPTALHPPSPRAVPEPEPPSRFRPTADAPLGSATRSDYFLPFPLGPPPA